jgi:hypothetical protein
MQLSNFFKFLTIYNTVVEMPFKCVYTNVISMGAYAYGEGRAGEGREGQGREGQGREGKARGGKGV